MQIYNDHLNPLVPKIAASKSTLSFTNEASKSQLKVIGFSQVFLDAKYDD